MASRQANNAGTVGLADAHAAQVGTPRLVLRLSNTELLFDVTAPGSARNARGRFFSGGSA